METARLLGTSLLVNKTLKHLDVSFNPDMGIGLCYFTRALNENRSLVGLSMNGCFVAAQDVISMTDTLEMGNRTLQSLQLASAIDLHVTSHILKMMRSNWCISEIYIDGETCRNKEVAKALWRNRNRRSVLAFMAAFHPRLGIASEVRCLSPISSGFLRTVSSFLISS